jgi:hypothetical protein
MSITGLNRAKTGEDYDNSRKQAQKYLCLGLKNPWMKRETIMQSNNRTAVLVAGSVGKCHPVNISNALQCLHNSICTTLISKQIKEKGEKLIGNMNGKKRNHGT